MYRYDLFVSLGQSYCIFIKYIHVYQTHQSKIEKFAHYFVLYAKFNLFDRTFNFSYFSDTQIFIDISHKKKMYKQCTHIGILNWSSSGDPHALCKWSWINNRHWNFLQQKCNLNFRYVYTGRKFMLHLAQKTVS